MIVQSEPILVSCETSIPFFNDFQILHAGSNTTKELSNFLMFFDEILYATSLCDCYLKIGVLMGPFVPSG